MGREIWASTSESSRALVSCPEELPSLPLSIVRPNRGAMTWKTPERPLSESGCLTKTGQSSIFSFQSIRKWRVCGTTSTISFLLMIDC